MYAENLNSLCVSKNGAVLGRSLWLDRCTDWKCSSRYFFSILYSGTNLTCRIIHCVYCLPLQPVAKKPKRTISISSDEESDEFVMEVATSKPQSGSDSGGRSRRAQAKPVTYVFSDDEEDEWKQISDGSDSDF